ncbi:hypothetical protein HPP92_009447 [Vanilla planifolia]|uniref:Uncharacterized protein n=1 Tax=Vanilla planifolia TaxID=51239 RepID=A0A835R7W6_VANPL|nr:hypothetical protein HPP92_009447 [Vanilla planifolia]
MGGEQVARGGGLIYIIKWHGLFMMLANIIYDLGESWIKLAVEKQSMQFTVYILKKESLASVEDIDNRKKKEDIEVAAWLCLDYMAAEMKFLSQSFE